MSENLNIDEQQEALRQVELILPQLSQEIVDIIVVVEEQLLPAIDELSKVCPHAAAGIKTGLNKTLSQIAASSGSIDSIQSAVNELRAQITGLTFITEEE